MHSCYSWYLHRPAIQYSNCFHGLSRSLRFNSTRTQWERLQQSGRPSLSQFRSEAFQPLSPCHLVSSFDLPASSRWIDECDASELSEPYFALFQDSLYLPMELTTTNPSRSFIRTTAPLALFLNYLRQLKTLGPDELAPRMYIAQAPLDLLPDSLRKDIPTPDFVLKTGKGDVYDSSLWMGPHFAARTPLHRDPNPNILVQVAGMKAVRLLPPTIGETVFRDVRSKLHSVTEEGSLGTMRGQEMMGEEGIMLDQIIWEDENTLDGAREAILKPGDGIFIPDGWWHSIRGVDRGINISVNWWFR